MAKNPQDEKEIKAIKKEIVLFMKDNLISHKDITEQWKSEVKFKEFNKKIDEQIKKVKVFDDKFDIFHEARGYNSANVKIQRINEKQNNN